MQLRTWRKGIDSIFVLAVFGVTLVLASFKGFASDSSLLISAVVTNGSAILPRTVFTQTWTLLNNGTTAWTPGESGYTLNLISSDSLGAVPMFANTSSSVYTVAAYINSGGTVPPGSTATYSMTFIAPEAAGSYTDTFQISPASGPKFGSAITMQINVIRAGSTNQFDRARAICYANNYAGKVVADGYFWTNGSGYTNAGAGAPVPTYVIGDDCAHFVSCCIGSEAHLRGGGLYVPSRAFPTYGEPGAADIINNILIASGEGIEVSSLTDMSPGDVIGWNWEGDTNIQDIDHVTLYLGNGLLAAHAESHLDVSATIWYQDQYDYPIAWHLIHILDAPTLGMAATPDNLVLTWTTNWSSYGLYWATNFGPGSTWTKVTTFPAVTGRTNKLTQPYSPTAHFYKLMMP